MKFEWDEKKRGQNLAKHGLDFADAWRVIGGDTSIHLEDVSHSQSECMIFTIGYLNETLCVVAVHTNRGDSVRIISFRTANKRERRLLNANS